MITPWVALGGFFRQTFEGEKWKKVFSDQVCARVSARDDLLKNKRKTARVKLATGNNHDSGPPRGGRRELATGSNHDSRGGSCDHDIAR